MPLFLSPTRENDILGENSILVLILALGRWRPEDQELKGQFQLLKPGDWVKDLTA